MGSASRLGSGLVLVAAFVVAAALLYLLAWQRVRSGIDQAARAKATLLQSGHTPWDFEPRRVDDLIAGRVFGDAVARPAGHGLRLRAASDKPYELGIPLPYPAALARFPVAVLALDVQVPTQLRWVARVTLDSPLLLSAPRTLHAGTDITRINLQTLSWTRLPSGQTVAAPQRVAMLRLKLQHPQGSTVTWHRVSWQRPATQGGATSPDTGIRQLTLATAGVETLLARRDAARQHTPATVVTASADALATPASVPRGPLFGGGLLLGYALLWLLVWRQTLARGMPPQECRPGALPALQIVVCAGPLLAGAIAMLGDPDPGPWLLAAMAAGIGLALWLAWREHGRRWCWLRWHGRHCWRDWAAPLATVALAALLVLGYRATPHGPGVGTVLAYTAWAGLQQILMLAVVAPRLRALIPRRGLCALAVAVLFALAHTPNALLMELTLLAEFLWAWSFLKRPVLLPVVVAHALTGMLLAASLGALPLRSLEVGARFLQ